MKKSCFNFLAFFAIVITFGFLTASCSKDEPSVPNEFFMDIATFVSSTENGVVVTVQGEGDSQPATISFPNQRITTDLKPGTRVLIAYRPNNGIPYITDTGTLYGMWYVYNGKITFGTKESTGLWMTMPQNILSVWRTGKWLNFQAECTYVNDKPTAYELVVDETTLGNPYPQVHLIYTADKGPDAQTQEFYASFDISEVWDLDNVQGIVLYVDGNNGMEEYTFEKQ